MSGNRRAWLCVLGAAAMCEPLGCGTVAPGSYAATLDIQRISGAKDSLTTAVSTAVTLP